METIKICPNCRKPLPPDAPLGLCPECLIRSGLPSATDAGVTRETAGARFVPPPIGEIAPLFPQLEILSLIGKGGMGAVYQGRQPALDRFVALKVLSPALAGDSGFAERFNREARALARLNHPNIVAVYDFGQAGRLHYLLMEFVDGTNLREILQAGKLSPEQALAIVPQICEALQFAHNEGIVHRDIKPENILLDSKGHVKITDFGIAKIAGLPAGRITLTGARDVVGTPHYMAPEQIEKPLTVDHRADIYSLGVVFYEMLTGELPLGRFAPPSKKAQIDVRLDDVVLRALEKEPERRYQHVSEVKTRVETITGAGTPPPAPAVSADELLGRDYALNIRHCLSRGWALLRSDFWPLVGMSAFVLAVLSAISSSGAMWSPGNLSIKTSILGALLTGPLLGGLYMYFLKTIRGEPAGVEALFTGFRQPLPHLVMAGFLTALLMVLGFVCLVLPGIYLLVAWKFTFPLVVDKGFDFWTAMRVSRKIISKHWWKFFGFTMILALINLLGIACLIVGIFITAPLTFAAMMYAYEDITVNSKSQPAKP
jgi:serine/threonine protein kinase